jgi:hypothetical protein
MAMGMLKARRLAVLHGVQLRFHSAVSPDLVAQVRGAADLDQLGQWLDAVLLAPDLSTFRGMIRFRIGA